MADLIDFLLRQVKARRIDARAKAGLNKPRAFIDGEDVLDAIADALGDIAGVIGKCLRRIARPPPAVAILKRLRKVPVIERGKRLDAVGQQFVQQSVVEIEALGIRRSASFRKYARPRDRKAIGLGAEFLDELNVLLVAMVMVVRDVGGALVDDLAGRCVKRSQIDGPRPSSLTAPSI